MTSLLRSFIRDEKGEDLIEYGLLCAFVAAVALAIVNNNAGLRGALVNAFQKAGNALNTMGQG